MLTQAHLQKHFSGVENLGAGIFRCKDVLPKTTLYSYVKLGSQSNLPQDFLLVSANQADDDFARLVLTSMTQQANNNALSQTTLPHNRYGFTQAIIAPPTWHANFKGRLDAEREELFLCVPAFSCEFTGQESIQEFTVLRREVVAIEHWQRSPSPKFLLRFDNPKTQSGTRKSGVLAKAHVLHQEIDRLDGVSNGFIEVINYQGAVLEILSPAPGQYLEIRERNDQSRRPIAKEEIHDRVNGFLVN